MAVLNRPIPDQANTSKIQLFPEAQSELGNDLERQGLRGSLLVDTLGEKGTHLFLPPISMYGTPTYLNSPLVPPPKPEAEESENVILASHCCA